MRRSLSGLILAAALAPAVHGQAVTVDVPDGATHRIEITGPVRYVYGPSGLTITFGTSPSPTPAPPTPAPAPEPLPPAAWGPLDRIIVLYESSKLTGRESIASLTVRDAMTAVTTREDGPQKLPRWRVWDKDLDAPDATVTVERVDWSDTLSDAKHAQGDSTDVILHAFDAKGRIKSIPLKGMTDEDAAKAIRDLGAAK